jgi:tetratricopeptide (TPR) repeat protein
MNRKKSFFVFSSISLTIVFFGAMLILSNITYAQDAKTDIQKKLEEAMMLKNKENNIDGAIKSAKEILIQDPKNVLALVFLGTMYTAKNDYNEALKNIDAALAINSKSAYALRSKANILGLQNKYKEAEQCFKSAIEISEPNSQDNAWSYFELSKLYLKQGLKDKASASLKKALEADPANSYFLEELKMQAPKVN